MAKERLKIIPLGGVGEIGRNMYVLEYKNEILLLDGGLMFPSSDLLGIDLVLPDITYLRDKVHKIVGWIFTHGHEDHIGAVPFYWEELGRPTLYGTRLTLGLLRVKLEAQRKKYGDLPEVVLNPGEPVQIGRYFRVTPFRVTHSIPDNVGFAVQTPAGIVVHTSDYKIDHTPADGKPTDLDFLGALGKKNVVALLADSLNAEKPGFTPSEQVVAETFRRVFSQAKGRIIIATFASNISRIQQVVDTAHAFGRKVAVVGRSMELNAQMARQLGYLRDPDGATLLPLHALKKLPDERVVMVCTGSQGEPLSALVRIANREHRQIRIQEGDTVIISATPIPGNEEAVHRTINSLMVAGAEVIYHANALVHVSGHGCQEEMKLMLSLVRPQFVVPIHGEYRMMVAYRRLAEAMGYPRERILMGETGSVFEFSQQYGKVKGSVPTSYVYVDGATVGEVGGAVIRDRQLLSRDGVVLVVVTLDRQTGEVLAGPDIVTRGFIYAGEGSEILDGLKRSLRRAFRRNGRYVHDWSFINRKIKDVASSYLYEKTRRRPMILPVVMEI